MSAPLGQTPLQSEKKSETEKEASLSATLVAVFILGALIVLGWGGAFLLYLSRT